MLRQVTSGYISLRRRDRTWSSTKFDFFNDPKNVSRHCGGHYNIKIKHFEDFPGGGGSLRAPPCHCRKCKITEGIK